MKRLSVISAVVIVLCGLSVVQFTGCDRKDNIISESSVNGKSDEKNNLQVITITRSNRTTEPQNDDWQDSIWAKILNEQNHFKIYYGEFIDGYSKAYSMLSHFTIDPNDTVNFGSVSFAGNIMKKNIFTVLGGGNLYYRTNYDFGNKSIGEAESMIESLRQPGLNFIVDEAITVQNYTTSLNLGQYRMTNITQEQSISAGQDLVITFESEATRSDLYIVPYVNENTILTSADTLGEGNLSVEITSLVPSTSIVIPKEELQSIRSKWHHDSPYVIYLHTINALDTLHMESKTEFGRMYDFPVFVETRHGVKINLGQ